MNVVRSVSEPGGSDKLLRLHNNHMIFWYLITFLFHIRVSYSCTSAIPAMASNISCISFAECSSQLYFNPNDDETWVLSLLTLEASFQYGLSFIVLMSSCRRTICVGLQISGLLELDMLLGKVRC